MSNTTDKLRSFYPDEISQEVYEAMLDIVDAVEATWENPYLRTAPSMGDVRSAVARLREVSR